MSLVCVQLIFRSMATVFSYLGAKSSSPALYERAHHVLTSLVSVQSAALLGVLANEGERGVARADAPLLDCLNAWLDVAAM